MDLDRSFFRSSQRIDPGSLALWPTLNASRSTALPKQSLRASVASRFQPEARCVTPEHHLPFESISQTLISVRATGHSYCHTRSWLTSTANDGENLNAQVFYDTRHDAHTVAFCYSERLG